MSKWTPGPWIAVAPSGPHIINGRDIANYSVHSTVAYHDAAKVDNKTIVSGQFMDRLGHEESAANARLIAAAPEMAEALERLTTRIHDCYSDVPRSIQIMSDEARALLARINGESQ